MKKNLNHKHSVVFDIVRTEINRLDPMGLIASACPVDEYDSEVSSIVGRIESDTTYIELSAHMRDVFSDMFDEDFSQSLFYDCAATILNKVNGLL